MVASIHKISMSGAGTSAAGALATSTTLIAMTTTTKILLAVGTAAAIGIPFLVPKPPIAQQPPAVTTTSAQSQTPQSFTTFASASKPEPGVVQQPRQLTEEEKQWEEAMAIPDDRALILAYFKKLGGTIKEEYVDQDIANVVKNNFGGNQAALERSLQGEGQTLEQFKQKRREDMIISVMKARATQDINISDPKERAVAREEAFKEWIQELRTNGGKESR